MKFNFKKIVIGLLIFFMAVLVARNLIVKFALQTALSTLTGLQTHVGKVRIRGLGDYQIRDIVIYNPQGFESQVLAEIPEIAVRLQLLPLISGERIQIDRLVLDAAQVNIEKTKEHGSNLDALTGQKKEEPRAEKKEKKEKMPFLLKHFELTVRRVRYVDRSGVVPKKIDTDLKLQNKVFENITGEKTLIGLIVFHVLYEASLGNIGIDMGKLQGSFEKVKDVIKVDDVAKAGTEKLLGLVEKAKEKVI